MIRLVCTDVDGTLVGSSGEVHPEVWPAVERARAAGIRLAVCSGRPAFGITRHLAERLAPEGWHSFQTGASIVHLPSGASRSSFIAEDTVALLVKRARSTGRLLELYTDHAYAVELTSDRARRHAGLLGVPFEPRPFPSLEGRIVRAQWLLPHDEVERVVAEPHPGLELTRSTSPLMPDTQFLNLTPAGVDKSTSVRLLAEQYGIPLDQVMFVGDGWNDVTALKLVGHPVAVANAEPEARAVARYVVGHVDEGGLAHALSVAISVSGGEFRQ